MGGKIVQLIQGHKKALEFENFDEWIERFSQFPLIQLIDLDAAIGTGHNRTLLAKFISRLPCQVGGGIRSVQTASEILALGASRVIIGSTLIKNGAIDSDFAQRVSTQVAPQNLVFAVDAKAGKVAIRGWREVTQISPIELIQALDSYCDAFLYTHIDTEGLMQGIPLDVVKELRGATTKQLIVAGGISTNQEINQLHDLSIDAVVGMALYLGKLDLGEVRSAKS
jgi:phosphoribosylformimino-5-aminoimidazole carboxamide ribotide isomerase